MYLCRVTEADSGGARIGRQDRSTDTVLPITVDTATDNFLRDGVDRATLRNASGDESRSFDDIELLAPIGRPTNLIGIGHQVTER